MSTEAVCIDHPESPAAGPCRRCGGFLCATCLVGGHCTACLGRALAPPRGIGGWLVLPMLTLFLLPLMNLAQVALLFVEASKAGGLAAVIEFDPRWVMLASVDVLLAVGISAWAVFIIPGFFGKRVVTVWRMQVLYAALFLSNAWSLAAQLLQADPEATSAPVGSQAVWSLVLPIAWAQYFRVSKRVKETFVR